MEGAQAAWKCGVGSRGWRSLSWACPVPKPGRQGDPLLIRPLPGARDRSAPTPGPPPSARNWPAVGVGARVGGDAGGHRCRQSDHGRPVRRAVGLPHGAPPADPDPDPLRGPGDDHKARDHHRQGAWCPHPRALWAGLGPDLGRHPAGLRGWGRWSRNLPAWPASARCLASPVRPASRWRPPF